MSSGSDVMTVAPSIRRGEGDEAIYDVRGPGPGQQLPYRGGMLPPNGMMSQPRSVSISRAWRCGVADHLGGNGAGTRMWSPGAACSA